MRNETVVADPPWVYGLMWIGFPVVGAAAGWGLKAISGWVAGLSWAPFQGVFRFLRDGSEPQMTYGALAVGALAGLVFAFIGTIEALKVTVALDSVTLKRGDKSKVYKRGSIVSAFADGKRLVLLGESGAELAREKSDLDAKKLAAAFTEHGYPWLADGDPYKDDFRRWVPDMPELPVGANALFKARSKAIADSDEHDIAELRDELGKLGVVVRDEKKRQYFRLV